MSQNIAKFKGNYQAILVEIVKRLPYAYNHLCHINDVTPLDSNIKEVLDFAYRLIDNKANELFTDTCEKIDKYLNDFSITPKDSIDNIDEFKIIFFTSKVLSVALKEKGLETTNKSVLVAMVWLLDYRLDTLDVRRGILTRQIIKTISNGDLFKETGEIGLYLTYKCLYNQAKDSQS